MSDTKECEECRTVGENVEGKAQANKSTSINDDVSFVNPLKLVTHRL